MTTPSRFPNILILAAALLALCLQVPLRAEEKPASVAQEKKLTPEEEKLVREANEASDRAYSFYKLGKYAEAEKEVRAALAIRLRVLGPDHFETLESRNSLAASLQPQGKNAEVEKEHRAVLAVRERVLGAEHPDTLWSKDELAIALHLQGKDVEAEQVFRAALKVRQHILDPKDGGISVSRYGLARALLGQGKAAEAEQELRPMLAILEGVRQGEYDLVYEACYYLGLCLESQGKFQEALGFAKRAEIGFRKITVSTRPNLKDAIKARGRIEAELKKQQAGGK